MYITVGFELVVGLLPQLFAYGIYVYISRHRKQIKSGGGCTCVPHFCATPSDTPPQRVAVETSVLLVKTLCVNSHSTQNWSV